MNKTIEVPLVVDLDGTLIRTDTLMESLLALLRHNTLCAFLLPLWLWRGKAVFKREIARRVELDAETLPYHQPLLHWLRQQRDLGRRLVLCTAADRRLAEQIAGRLQLFDEVLASDGKVNLKGRRKEEALVARFGSGGFDYVANAAVDLPVWRRARTAIVVNPVRAGLVSRVRRESRLERVFEDRTPRLPTWWQALRVHQWAKNVLLFVPLFAAHELANPRLLQQALLAFVSFSLVASANYLLNDLLDLGDDRRHPSKHQRAFAAGTLPLWQGLVAVPLLLAGGLAVAWLGPGPEFLMLLVLYLVTTVLYSLWLKTLVLVDVLVLAGLYTWRIIAGGVAVEHLPSFWLLAFSVFLFLSLALVKRCTELGQVRDGMGNSNVGRGYHADDLPLLRSLGSSAGYLSVLVLALYINSPASAALYSRPEALWLLCPLLLYWISRVWMMTHRGDMHEDPVVFALGDRVSHLLLGIGLVIVWSAL